MSISSSPPDSIMAMDIEKDHTLRESPIIPKTEPQDLDLYPDPEKTESKKIDDMDDPTILDFSDLNEEDSMHQQLFGLRRQRKFILEVDKDDLYWDRRKRNNEAAKRSREKRRVNDMILESRVMELSKQNNVLRAQLDAMYIRDQRPASASFGNAFSFHGNENGFCQVPQQFFRKDQFPCFPPNVQYASPMPQIKRETNNIYDSISRRNSLGHHLPYGDVPMPYSNNNYIVPNFPKFAMNNHLSDMTQSLPINPLLSSEENFSSYGAPDTRPSRKRLNSDPTPATTTDSLQHSPTSTDKRDILVATRHRHYSTTYQPSNSMTPVCTNIPLTAASTVHSPTFSSDSQSSLRSTLSSSFETSMSTNSLVVPAPMTSSLLPKMHPVATTSGKESESIFKSSKYSTPLFSQSEKAPIFPFSSNKDLSMNQNYPEPRTSMAQKPSIIENSGEKRKQFIINEMLEQCKKYPQDLDTALNLSNPTLSGDIINDTKDDGVQKRIDEDSDIKSLRRVPSITSENSNNDPKACLTPTISPLGCSSPTRSTSSSTSNHSDSSDLSSSKIFSPNSANETFLPYKLRFKSGLYNNSQNSFGYDHTAPSDYDVCN